MGGRIGVLVTLEGSTDASAAKDVAMHIAAINPTYVSRDEVSAEEVERERKVLTEQALNEGKPENIVAKWLKVVLVNTSKMFAYLTKHSLKTQIKST